ncbi:MAG: hypothetical protein V4577_07755 [Bacteroidota bacterium]
MKCPFGQAFFMGWFNPALFTIITRNHLFDIAEKFLYSFSNPPRYPTSE